MSGTETFIRNHKLRSADIDMDKLVESFISEMDLGLEGKTSSLRMIPTYIEADNEFIIGKEVLAIDAGGTNFRSALMGFSTDGKLNTGTISNFRMPGLEGEVSADEFFNTMAGYIKAHAGKCDRIGFCFSYPTEILPSRDGILLQFCKEVQAPGVVGQLVGKRLLEALGTPDKSIVLLNDTVATLLAGKSASIGKKYDSFIGFILGTGTNTCYIEKNGNITKTGGLDPVRNMIINIESGNFGKPPRTDLDIKFDNTTMNPGNYGFEKMFSGGYIGGLCLTVLKSAAEEGLFSQDASEKLSAIKDLSSNDASSFAADSVSEGNGLSKCFTLESDIITARLLIDTLIDRAAKLVAGNIAAVLLKTGKGKSAELPVLITIEGTAFYKLHNLKPSFEKYMKEYLSGDKLRFYEFTEVQQSSLVGAGLAALIG